jgi:hypothetical protein
MAFVVIRGAFSRLGGGHRYGVGKREFRYRQTIPVKLAGAPTFDPNGMNIPVDTATVS